MKITSAFFAGLLLIGAPGVVKQRNRCGRNERKVPLTASKTVTVHEQFLAIEGRTLDSNNPTLKDANSGDGLTTTARAVKSRTEKINSKNRN